MRSRYTAYVLKDEFWLRKTWHPDTCPNNLCLDDASHWLGLKIQRVEAGGRADNEGEVEFVARYKVSGKAYRLHENSRFVRHDGQWVYLNGEVSDR